MNSVSLKIARNLLFALTFAVLGGAAALAQDLPPELELIRDTSINEMDTLEFFIVAHDPDIEPITFDFFSATANDVLIPQPGDTSALYRYTPNANESGIQVVWFYARTPLAVDSQSILITVINVNQPPHFLPLGDTSVVEGDTLYLTIIVDDDDIFNDPVITASMLPPGADTSTQIPGRLNLSWSPTFNLAPDTVEVIFTALDGGGLEASDTIAIAVLEAGNQRPVLFSIGPKITVEDDTLEFTIAAADPDSTELLFATGLLPANATFDTVGGKNLFTFIPSSSQVGTDSVLFIASDSGGKADSESVVITIEPNLPPVLDSIGPKTVLEGVPLIFTVSATDPNSVEPFVYPQSSLPQNATCPPDTGATTFTFLPSYVQAGTYPITFYARDNKYVDSETVVITVNEVGNQRPRFALIEETLDLIEGQAYQIGIIATDPENETLTFSLLPGSPDNDSLLPLGQEGLAVYRFAPWYNQGGIYDPVRIIVADTAEHGSPLGFDTLDFHITVHEIDHPPQVTVRGITTTYEGSYLVDTISVVDDSAGDLDIWMAPDTSLIRQAGGTVYFDMISENKMRFELYPDFGFAATALSQFADTFFAADAFDTNFSAGSITVTPAVRSQIEDTADHGDPDFVHIPAMEWDGIGVLSVTVGIYCDSGIAGALTGFRWSDPRLKCSTIVLASMFDTLDADLYWNTEIFNDSSEIVVEFLYFNNDSISSLGDNYFTAYFTYQDTLPWPEHALILFDSTKIGNRGDFIFDKRLRPYSAPERPGDDLAKSANSPFTYRPLVQSGRVRAPKAPVAVGDSEGGQIPRVSTLSQNFPNPFNPQTSIRFNLVRSSRVILSVYNILGQEIRRLADKQYQAGPHSVEWDGNDDRGSRVASGIYLYRIVADGIDETRKMILLK